MYISSNCSCSNVPSSDVHPLLEVQSSEGQPLINNDEDRPAVNLNIVENCIHEDNNNLSDSSVCSEDTVLYGDSESNLLNLSTNSTILYSNSNSDNADTESDSDFDSNDTDSEFSFVQSSDDESTINSESTILYSRSSSTSNTDNMQNQNEGIKIWYTNADSNLNKREEMLAEIELNRPDVIVITELFPKTVKATDLNIVEFQLDSYNLCTSRIEDKCRGVGIYIHKKLSYMYTECSALNNKPFKESCWCELKMKNNETLLTGAI